MQGAAVGAPAISAEGLVIGWGQVEGWGVHSSFLA